MRKAVLMEDSGVAQYVQTCKNRSEAEKWIRDQEGKYFGPDDYYINYKL